MDYELISGSEAFELKNFIPAEILPGFEQIPYRFALYAIENQRVAGVAVFDAKPVVEICSIRVIEEYRGTMEPDLLLKIAEIAANLDAVGIVFEIYDEDDPDFWESILHSALFFAEDTNILYQFSLQELKDHPLMKRFTAGEHAISLGQAQNASLRTYSNTLIQNGAYDHFLTGNYDPELSSLYIDESGEIAGCLLVSDFGQEKGFSVEYVNTEGCRDRMALVRMLKRSADAALAYYRNPDVSGYVLTMNEVSDKIIRELFPKAEPIDHCSTYVRVLKQNPAPVL